MVAFVYHPIHCAVSYRKQLCQSCTIRALYQVLGSIKKNTAGWWCQHTCKTFKLSNKIIRFSCERAALHVYLCNANIIRVCHGTRNQKQRALYKMDMRNTADASTWSRYYILSLKKKEAFLGPPPDCSKSTTTMVVRAQQQNCLDIATPPTNTAAQQHAHTTPNRAAPDTAHKQCAGQHNTAGTSSTRHTRSTGQYRTRQT